MRYHNLELHGIEELIDVRGRLLWSRYPMKINELLQHDTALQMVSGEIRLVVQDACTITIGSLYCWTQAKLQVFYGDHAEPQEVIFNKETTLLLQPNVQLLQVKNNVMFDPSVIRIVLLGEAFYIKNITGTWYYPNPSLLPSKKILAYGTSITQGLCATSCELSYPNILARSMGYDVKNYGLSGHCFCEREVSDFLSTSDTYDIVLLEVSVNMFTSGYSIKEYKQRVEYLVSSFLSNNPKAQIYCIGLMPFYYDFKSYKDKDIVVSTPQEYREALRSLVFDINEPKLHYINGQELLSKHNLSSDLIHPSNFGMIEIAQNLERILLEEKKPNKER